MHHVARWLEVNAMAVSTEAYKALARTSYSAARPSLRTGDILLFHSVALGSLSIELGTHSLWSHAALVWRLSDIDRVILLESMDTVGVRTMPMSTRVNGCAASPTPYNGGLLVLRHPGVPEKIDDVRVRMMTQFALDRVGFPLLLPGAASDSSPHRSWHSRTCTKRSAQPAEPIHLF